MEEAKATTKSCSNDAFQMSTLMIRHSPRLTYKSTVLDAPGLRDDFYCSVLAYCPTAHCLAVGLQSRVYLWSETSGVTNPRGRGDDVVQDSYVTSLAFSSDKGKHCILAIGRSDGRIAFWSIFEEGDRIHYKQNNAIACLSFKPICNKNTEELLVGDEVGIVSYFSIEWADNRATMILLLKIDIHTQQICGIAWAPDGEHFATGSNDNVCLLFSVRDISTPAYWDPIIPTRFTPPMTGLIPDFVPNAPSHTTLGSMLAQRQRDFSPSDRIIKSSPKFYSKFSQPYSLPVPRQVHCITAGRESHRWLHSAAVKAIAFCPWQRGLLATGGGSNDRAIHFFHAWSGACLATISVQAQVTSLIWSKTRREIAATFGYAQPDHPYRIAVFSWPNCKQVVAVPWNTDMRALYAIPYPGGPNETRHCGGEKGEGEGGRWWNRTAEEGCIVVAGSDESVKFHEIWSGTSKGISGGGGIGGLGGSDILEGLEGVDKDWGEIIR